MSFSNLVHEFMGMGMQQKKGIDWKIEGNRLFVQRKYEEAISFYLLGLLSDAKDLPPEVEKDLLANRAAAYIAIRCFQHALYDCDRLLTMDPAHFKGIYRKTKALCGLQRVNDAILFLSASKKHVKPQHQKDYDEILVFAQTQKEQKEQGNYDFLKLFEAKEDARHEVADFIGPLEMVVIEGKGRGLVATQDIKAGELIIVNKAFAVAFLENNGTNLKESKSLFVNAVRQRLTNDPSLRREFYTLYGGPKYPIPLELENVDMLSLKYRDIYTTDVEQCVYEAYPKTVMLEKLSDEEAERVDAICIHNSVELDLRFKALNRPSTTANLHCNGIWTVFSYINHSCVDVNASWYIFGDVLVVRSLKTIKKGEEILLSYTDPTQTLKCRQTTMKWQGFQCACRLCLLDQDISKKGKKRIKILQDMFDPNPKTTIDDLESNIQELDQLKFPQKLNPSLVTALLALGEHYYETKNYKKSGELYERCHSVAGDAGLATVLPISCSFLIRSYLMAGNVGEAKNWIPILEHDFRLAYGTTNVARLLLSEEIISLMENHQISIPGRK